jgi:hypothetical protein
MRATRFIPALVIAGVLSGTAISQAQIICSIPCPIFDFSADIQHVIQIAQAKAMTAVLGDQSETLTKMATRITKWISLAHYLIHLDDTPEWRIHDFWTDAVITAKAYHHALTYGDRNGDGYATVTEPRVDADDALASLPPDAADYLRAELATLDLADSSIIRGTDESGRVRYGSRAETEAIDVLQHDVTDSDPEASATAILDKISGAQLVEVRDKQVRLQLRAAILEQLLVDSKRRRDAAAVTMNGFLRGLRAQGAMDRSLVQGDDTLLTWSQP